MKKLLLVFLTVTGISFSAVFNIYESLGITKDEAKENALYSLGEGWIQQKHGENILSKVRDLPAEKQAEGARQLVLMMKEYSESETFQDDYKKWRQAKLNPPQKSKLGVPKLGKMLDKKMDNALNKGELDKKYPVDAQEMIKNRLEEFLRLAENVDFEAELTDRRFKDPAYELKSKEWKACYRAGKPIVTAASEEIEKWLKEINS